MLDRFSPGRAASPGDLAEPGRVPARVMPRQGVTHQIEARAMSLTEELSSDTKSQMKMRELARSCGWLETVLQQQGRLLDMLDDLAASPDASSWKRHWASLEFATVQHFRVEQDVLGPAIHAMGQRAHAVVAEARRRQIRLSLEDLRYPSLESGSARARLMRLNLADHFAQEESWGYQALARQHDDEATARLTVHCRQVLAEAAR